MLRARLTFCDLVMVVGQSTYQWFKYPNVDQVTKFSIELPFMVNIY